MAKTAQEKAAEEAAKKAAEEKAAEDKAAEDKAAADKAAADDGDDKKKPKTFTEAEVKAREKAAAEKAAADAKKKFEEEKDLSENERLKKENDELRAANRLRDAKDSFLESIKGAKNPELLWKAAKDDLEFADDGKIKNLDSLVTNLKTDYSDQFGVEPPKEGIDGGAGGGAGKGAAGGTLTADQLGEMTPQEVAKLPWDDVKAAMVATN